jgi:hypothetical protein
MQLVEQQIMTQPTATNSVFGIPVFRAPEQPEFLNLPTLPITLEVGGKEQGNWSSINEDLPLSNYVLRQRKTNLKVNLNSELAFMEL